MQIDTNELLRGLEKILQISEGSARADAALSDYSTWDSMGVMEFIVLVDDHFGTSIPAHEISECRTIGDLIEICSKHVTD